MTSKIKQKEKKKEETEQVEKIEIPQSQDQEQKERLAFNFLQKQLQVLRLKEWVVLVSFIFGGAIGRSLMQGIPSVEPLTLFAFLAGALFGRDKGFFVGASSLVASNFIVFGGQGPWTIFQALGFGIAGYLGGFLSKKPNYISSVVMMIIATLIFEIIVNIGSAFTFGFMSLFFLFFTALPFSLVHLGSNFLFALSVPKLAKAIYEGGKFNEKDICLDLINRYRRNRNIFRNSK